jgi:hypothetical protein
MARLDELNRFLRDALASGISREKIRDALIAAGWQREQVEKGLASYADVPFPLPVPRPTPHLSAGEAFIHLVIFTALGFAAFSAVEIFFHLIEISFYDPAVSPPASRSAWTSSVRWSLARVIIAFPVFLFASWLAARALKRDPAERGSPVRRWLTYVAMFIASCVIIGDFVTLVAYVLAGETTIRFLLKVAVVAAMAGGILGHYLAGLSERRAEQPAQSIIALIAAMLVAALALGAGFWIIGTPAEQAAIRIDQRRVQELGEIARAVDLYHARNNALPQSIGDVSRALKTPVPLNDPEGKGVYEYNAESGATFELCAVFAEATESVVTDSVWTHGPGRQCFTLTAGDKERR